MIYSQGVAYSQNTGALIFNSGVASYAEDGKMYTPPAEFNKDFGNTIWSPWGEDNLLPYEMRNHIENCGVLNAALDGKGRIAVGKGFEPFLKFNVTNDGKEELEWISDPEIQDWLEENNVFDFAFDSVYDQNAYGWNCGGYILNKGRTRINRIYRQDVFDARLQKIGRNGYIKNLIVCDDWENAKSTFDPAIMNQVKLLREMYEFADLEERKNESFEFAFINRRKRNGRKYYSFPLWWAARAWVKIARSVPAFKNAMFKNQMQIKYIIHVSDQYWVKNVPNWETITDEKKKEEIMEKKYKEIETWLTSEEKAYKTIVSGKFFDPVQNQEIKFIEVETLDDKMKDGKLLPDSSAANSEILFSIMMNPALIGAGQPGGPYSNNAGGSNIRESYLVQLMLMEAERRMNSEQWIPIKKFNGWAKKYEKTRALQVSVSGPLTKFENKNVTPRLVLRYPSGLLTTLDTGKSTKSENV